AGHQAVDGVVERLVRDPMARQATAEPGRKTALGQLEGVTEMPSCQLRVAVFLQRDPAERHVNPEIVAAPLERESERIAGRFRVARMPELDTFFVIELHFADTARMDQ